MEIIYDTRTSFKTLSSEKATTWRLKKAQNNDKLLRKTISSSYHTEQKTFIEAGCTSNKQTGEKDFRSFYFQRFVSCFYSD